MYALLIGWNICKDRDFYDNPFTAKRKIYPFNSPRYTASLWKNVNLHKFKTFDAVP
jgi:hypothetical protein